MTHPLRAIIAELTHRCPLHCVYCSNPLVLQPSAGEMGAAEWAAIFQQAAGLGALHLHLTGGEPLARRDLLDIVQAGHAAGLYLNLITSGIGLDASRLDALVAAGLDHIQLSFQDAWESSANEIAGTRAHAAKLQAAHVIRERRLAFTVNVVVHRRNLDRIEEMIALAEQSGASRLEIANVQYYGWAFKNREALLPTRAQLDHSRAVVDAATERLRGRLRIEFVLPDYYARFPKPCMNGWGRQQMVIDPAGRALPCHSAMVLPGLELPNLREHPLRWVWEQSPAFERFRGVDWMEEPCRSCDRRDRDFGGCRCQAQLMAGRAEAADPVCSLSGDHAHVEAIVARVNAEPPPAGTPSPWIHRPQPA